MKKVLSMSFGFLALSGLLACENVDSTDVKTSGVYADIKATADGSGQTLVKTTLRVGGARSNTFLDLVGGDKLLAYHAEDEQEMERKSLFGSVWYEKSFAVDAEDTPFKVSFVRSDDLSAPESNLTLPAPFAITSPVASDFYSRAADDIILSWDASGTADQMEFNLDGDCIRILHRDLDGDTGSYTISHDDIELASDADEGTTCEVTLTLERHRAGQLDSAYGEGGTIFGLQTRSVKIQSEM